MIEKEKRAIYDVRISGKEQNSLQKLLNGFRYMIHITKFYVNKFVEFRRIIVTELSIIFVNNVIYRVPHSLSASDVRLWPLMLMATTSNTC